ncbi:MAG: class I SAM-dependent methyltransferase [Pseudomonadota bacterium]
MDGVQGSSPTPADAPDAGAGNRDLMDAVYRYQRHFYDLTRKYYLLGRDRMIAELAPPAGGSVLEVGCGTGRNLIAAAKRYPDTRFYGLDISPAMLETARASISRAGLSDRIQLTEADATNFDVNTVFGSDRFDRVFFSYSLSMIPPWEAALTHAAHHVAPGGRLHVVDFGNQERLPRWFAALLHHWLAAFHVAPRTSMREALKTSAAGVQGKASLASLYRGYAVLGRITTD